MEQTVRDELEIRQRKLLTLLRDLRADVEIARERHEKLYADYVLHKNEYEQISRKLAEDNVKVIPINKSGKKSSSSKGEQDPLEVLKSLDVKARIKLLQEMGLLEAQP